VTAERDHALVALTRFDIEPGYTTAPVGNGLIHTTLAVSYDDDPRYVLQRINTGVFPDPHKLAENARVVTSRLEKAVVSRGGDVDREVLRFVPSRDGGLVVQDDEGGYWRLARFVRDSATIDIAEDVREAGAIASAFARFQLDLWDLAPESVSEAIPGFHDTPARYRRLLAAARAAAQTDDGTLISERYEQARDDLETIAARAHLLGVIEDGRASGALSSRICHNDTKVNNVLIDAATRRTLCVIDLDTIGPGSPLMDVGDLLRTAAATATEEEQDTSLVAVDPTIAAAITSAFRDVLAARLNEAERSLLSFGGWMITMEQAVRFLTDFLEGDAYYGERYPAHNLFRARNQLALAASMEREIVDLGLVASVL
jgi:Ser/Thr protein kinase RdoA (MazF antagonist)